jgi:peptide chain release factor 1
MDIIRDKLHDIELRYRELEGQLSDPKIVSKPGMYQKYAKEYADLKELVETIREYNTLRKQIDEYQDVMTEGDEELKAIVKEELPQLKQQQTDLEDRLTILLSPKDPNDNKNVFWKSGPEPEVTKRVFLPQTCSGCTPAMPKPRAGASKW